jgi:hypothetical protein
LAAFELGNVNAITQQCIRDAGGGDWVMDGFWIAFDSTPRGDHTGSWIDHPWHNLNSAGSGHITDREAIAVHEAGHGLGFDHFLNSDNSCDSGAGAANVLTMCEGSQWELARYQDGGQENRSLEIHDTHTLQNVY